MLKNALALLLVASGPAAWSASFDHSAFDTLLRKNVVNGMVDYDAFKVSPDFPRYFDALSKSDPSALDDQERLAYWINVYNAYTIQLINEHQERASIRNINRTLGIAGKGPWREKLVKAGGQVYHLDNVEHDIIRKQWKEPRIHFALVCAAMSCPPLRSEAYTGAKLEEQLADQARKFLIETPVNNRVDVKTATVHGSMIYVSYYREDFGSTDEAIGRYLALFYAAGPEKQLLLSGKFKLVGTDYDWTLNSQEQARKRVTSVAKPWIREVAPGAPRSGARGLPAATSPRVVQGAGHDAAIVPKVRVTLWNGRDVTGWTIFLGDSSVAPGNVWSASEGVLRFDTKASGYLKTEKSFSNYHLHVEWRWPKDAAPNSNSGVMVHLQGADAIWPSCFEAQLRAGNAGQVVGIGLDIPAAPMVNNRKRAPRLADPSERPFGEWNTYEIFCRGGTIEVFVNGVRQNYVEGLTVAAGPIALQMEGFPIEFREVWLEPLR